MIAMFLVSGAMAQWFQQNSGTTNNLNSVYFTDSNTGYVVGDTGTIIKTNDGGENWRPQNSGTVKDLYSVHFTTDETGYAVGDNVILKTENDGLVWISQSMPIPGNWHSVYFTSTDTGYIVGEAGNACILKTINGGLTWNINYIYYGPGIIDSYFTTVCFTDANTGYAGGSYMVQTIESGGLLLKTTNGGTDWTELSLPNSDHIDDVCFLNTDTGYAIKGEIGWVSDSLLKTTNGGLTWQTQNISSATLMYLDHIFFTNADTGYVVGWLGTILKTMNGGPDYSSQSTGTTNWLVSVYFPASDTGYCVGTNGTILKTTNGGGYPVGINDYNPSSDNLSIHPNPASTSITIETPSPGQLNILNLNGQPLLTRRVKETKTFFDISTLPSGVYVVKVVGEKGVKVGKVIKQ